MSFEPKTQAFNSSISSVTIGTGDKAVTLGGINVLPFYAFDAPITNAPKIGVEITDHRHGGLSAGPVCRNSMPAARPWPTWQSAWRRCDGASFICLHFEGADPNGENTLRRGVRRDRQVRCRCSGSARSSSWAARTSRRMRSSSTQVSEALQGKNILVFSAREENYKTVGASAVMAYSQKVGAESAVDINLAKQLNVLMTQLGVAPTSIVMNVRLRRSGLRL